jgi:hypothetical protein
MAAYLDAVEARLVAILEAARGASGLGATALQYHLPLATVRPTPSKAPLREVTAPDLFDGAYWLEWADDDDGAVRPRNPLDNHYRVDAKLRVHLGAVAGPAREGVTKLLGTESAAAVVLYARRRALGLARRVGNALTCFDLVLGGLTPEVADVASDGATTTEDLGDGRVIATVPLKLTLWVDATASLLP